MSVYVHLELTLNPGLFSNGLQGSHPSDSVLIQVNAAEVSKSAKSPIARVLQDAKENGATITKTGDRSLAISVADRDIADSLTENLRRTDRAKEVHFYTLAA